ncbi:MAG: hypothetical protein R3C14_41690 [Caldilineaceae bacterium]
MTKRYSAPKLNRYGAVEKITLRRGGGQRDFGGRRRSGGGGSNTGGSSRTGS